MIIVFLSLLFNLWIAYQIPYTHDDWDWGLPVGIQHLLTADINSRYAGNLVVVLLTRSPLLKTFVMGLVFTLIPLLSAKVALLCVDSTHESPLSSVIPLSVFLLANILILSLPADVWCQTNGWVSGFSNFVVSGLALLLFFLLLLSSTVGAKDAEIPAHSSSHGKMIQRCTGFLIFGVVIQLFLENLALFFFICSLAFLVYSLQKNRNVLPVACSLLAGTTAGMLIMFSSGIYKTLWETGYAVGTYRQLVYDRHQPVYVFLLNAGYQYLGSFLPAIVSNHKFLASIISFLLLLHILQKWQGKGTENAKGAKYLFLCIVNAVYSVYYLFCYFRGVPEAITSIKHLRPSLDLLFLFVVSCEIVIIFYDRKDLLFSLLLTFGSTFVILAPMVIINTFGPRIFYTTDLCLILFCQILLASYLLEVKDCVYTPVLLGCLIICLLFGLNIGSEFYSIGVVSRQRTSRIQQAVEMQESSLVLPQITSHYLWLPNPKSDERKEYFRAFYGIPEQVTLEFED